MQAAGQENGAGNLRHDPAAQRPVMHPAGAAEFLDRRGGTSGIQQQGIGMVGALPGLFHRFRAGHMNDLDDLHMWQCLAQCAIGLRVDGIDELHRAGAAFPHMIDDGVGFGFAGQQECGHRRRRRGRDLGDQLVPNDPRAAGHMPDKPQRRRTVPHGKRGFRQAGNATYLDPYHRQFSSRKALYHDFARGRPVAPIGRPVARCAASPIASSRCSL